MRHRHDTNKWFYWALIGILALACIFICSDFVRAEDLKYDIITYADANELGRKVCGVIGYVDTVKTPHSNYTYEYFSPKVAIPVMFANYDSVQFVRVYHPNENVDPPDSMFIYRAWETWHTFIHRQWVNTELIPDFEQYSLFNKEGYLTAKWDTCFAEPKNKPRQAVIWWREVTK